MTVFWRGRGRKRLIRGAAACFSAALLILSGCKGSSQKDYIEVFENKPENSFVRTTAQSSAAADAPEDIPDDEERDDEPVRDADDTQPSVPEKEPDYEAFSAALSAAKEKYEITGMSAALFKDGRVIHTRSLGYADAESGLPCGDNTRYRVASVSKLISTIVLMTLYDKGVISPGTRLSDVCDIAYDDPKSDQKTCLWHLLTHTAGIVDTYDYDTTAVTARTDINTLLAYAHSGNAPGTVYSYSNFGAGTIGALVERLTGEFFYNYADEVLFKPLGMDAGYLIDKITDTQSCAKLYDYDGEIFDVKNWGRRAAYYDSFGLGNSYYLAQCELIITASDLARLGIMLVGGGEVDGVRILSEEAVEMMDRSYFSAPDFDMGLNVRIYDELIEGRRIYGHPGNALGVITGLFYDPSDGTGVVLLTNHCIGAVDENGFYKANKDVLTAAYEYIF